MSLSVFLNDINFMFFIVAFVLLMLSFLAEAIGFLIVGTGIFSLIDGLIPDIDTDAPDFHGTFITNALSWAKHKNTPASIWMAIVLGIFSIIGFSIQAVSIAWVGHSINLVIASLVALVPALLIARKVCVGLGEVVFIDHTSAVSTEELIGCKAIITIGRATSTRAAECKIIDKKGGQHYMMCRAEVEGDEFINGDPLIITSVIGNDVTARFNRH